MKNIISCSYQIPLNGIGQFRQGFQTFERQLLFGFLTTGRGIINNIRIKYVNSQGACTFSPRFGLCLKQFFFSLPCSLIYFIVQRKM